MRTLECQRDRVNLSWITIIVAVVSCASTLAVVSASSHRRTVPTATLYAQTPADQQATAPPADALRVTFYRPEGLTPMHSQVQIGFNHPLVPLTSITDAQRQQVLSCFRLSPSHPGRFRMVGVSAVVFSPDYPFPPATKYFVSVSSGLTDLKGFRLRKEHKWAFWSESLRVTISMGDATTSTEAAPARNIAAALSPRFNLSSNAALNIASLKQSLRLYRVSSGGKVQVLAAGLSVKPSAQNPPAIQKIVGDSRSNYYYTVSLQQSLDRNTGYRLSIAKGLEPEVGNRSSDRTFSLNFSTYAPLSITLSRDKCGDRLRENYWINNNNPLVPASLKKAIQITPKLSSGSYLEDMELPQKQLKPDTDYTITVSPKIRDVYGQQLGRLVVLKFHTADYRPDIRILQGMNIITPITEPNVPCRFQNPGKATTRTFGLSLEDFLARAFTSPAYSIDNFIAGMKAGGKTSSQAFGRNANVIQDLPLGGLLNPSGRGIAFYSMATSTKDCTDPPEIVERAGALLRTNIGLHVQVLPAGVYVWATHLTDGSPVTDGEARIYRIGRSLYEEQTGKTIDADSDDPAKRQPNKWPDPDLRFSGQTNDAGQLLVPASKLTKSAGFLDQGNELLVVVREGGDYAFAVGGSFLDNELGLWWFDVSQGWDGPKPEALGTLYSDRQLYLDGETATMKGVVRYRTEDRIVTPKELSLKVMLEDPNGDSRSLGSVTTDEFGTFSLTIPTEPGAPLGYYYVRASSEKPELEYTGSFRVADFQPPRYKASITTDKNLYLVGEEIAAKAAGEYLFGAPLTGGEATFTVNTEPQYFSPPGWDEYAFGLPDWIMEEMDDRESPEKNLAEKTFELDAKGQYTFRVPVVAGDVPEPMQYSVGVDVKDVSGQSVGATKQITALPYPQLIGVKVDDSFVAAKKSASARVVVTDPAGKAVAGVPLRIELRSVEWTYKTVKEDDYTYDRYLPEFKTVATQTITSGTDSVEVTFAPAKPGDYVVQGRFDGRQPTGTEGADWLYAYGETSYFPRGQDEEREDMELKFKTDREEYKVGDTVSLAVPSPFKNARALITVEREKLLWQQTTGLSQGITPIEFQVTKDMIPNVFVEVALIETGDPKGNLFEKYAHRPYRVGIKKIPVSRDPHRLDVSVSPVEKSLRPGGKAAVDFLVKDAKGKPAQVQLTVMAVDEAILQLTGYRPPDLVEELLPERNLSLVLLDNRPYVIHAGRRIPMHKGYGYGGGESESLAIAAEVRKDFKRLAYFNADLRTDAEGKAHCEFKVPDNLTTWRIMTVALSRETDSGYGDSTIVVNQPLLLDAMAPRFARVDDSVTVGVAINNQTGVDGDATVSYETVEGASHLIPDSNTARVQTVKLPAGRTTPVRWKQQVVGIGDSVFRFSCVFTGKGGNGQPVQASDGLELRFHTQEPGQMQTVAVTDEVEDKHSVDLKLTPDMRTDIGEVVVSLSSTAYGNLTPDADYLLKYPYGCAEQTASKLLGLLAIEEPAKKFGLKLNTTSPLHATIESSLKKLLLCQKSDGGFGYWTDDKTSFRLTVYIAEVLSRVRAGGYDVPDHTISKLADYLRKYQSGNSGEPWRMHDLVLRADALQALGAPDKTYYAEMFAKKSSLPLSDWIRLASVYYASRDWRKQSDELFGEINKRDWITTRSAHLEQWLSEDNPWLFFESPTSIAAMGLKLDLLRQPNDPRVSKTVNYLIGSDTRNGWRDTYDTAQVLDAVGRYVEVRESRKPDFSAEVQLDGKRNAGFEFRGYQLGQQVHTIPLRQLSAGGHQLGLSKRGDGTLFSTVELNYYPTSKQPPLSEGFYIERTMTNLRTGKDVTSGGEIKVGDVIKVKLMMNAPQNGNHVVVEAPIPAGMMAVDTSFKTTPDWQSRETEPRGWGYYDNPFNHVEQRKDQVALFAQNFTAGVYDYTFLLQATNPGSFILPPARIYRMYEPEEFGATGWGRLVIGG